MNYQDAPRRSLSGCQIPENKGFWLDGKNRSDCFQQLQQYGKQHPEKWIYYYDCGVGPGYPVPVARQLFEVSIYDAEPAGMMLFSRLFQEGKDGKREIDMMSDEEITELRSKQMTTMALLGSML